MAKKSDNTLASPSKPMEMKPTLQLGEKDLPAIKDWKVGGKYKIVVEVEQTRLSKGEYDFDESSELKASFKVLKAEPYKDPELEGWGDDDEDED